MALAATSLINSSAASASVSGFTTASISPTANSLLLLSVGGFDGTGSQDFTVNTVSGLGLTWARKKLGIAGSTPKGDVEAWAATCGATPGSGTITVSLTIAFSGGVAWGVDQFTGEDTTTPVVAGNIVASNNSSAASSVTYGSAASSSNLFWFMNVVLLGGGGNITQAPSETPPWTALSQSQSDTTTFNGASLATQVSPDVTHLTGSSSWSGSHSWGTIGLEISASSGGTPHTATASLTVTPSRTANRTRAATRTASLTPSLSFTAARRRAAFRTAALTVTPSLTVSRTASRHVTAALNVAVSRSVTRTGSHPRNASLTVTPSTHAVASGGSQKAIVVAVAGIRLAWTLSGGRIGGS